MANFIRPMISTAFIAACFFANIVVPLTASAYNNSPDRGALYYNGRYYLGSFFAWTKEPTWENASPGYEHDLHIPDENFFSGSCTSYTTLPAGYDDCPTAGIFDRHGPVYSFGSFDAKSIERNQWYYGAWRFTTHGNAWYSSVKLQGQESENKCLGLRTIWCMFATDTDDLLIGYYLVWGGWPRWVYW